MEAPPPYRLTDSELNEFFDRMFPQGLAGADVLADIAPEGWENSPLLACFHPPVEQVLQEWLQIHRSLEEQVRRRREQAPDNLPRAPRPEPTLEEVRAEWESEPVNETEEVTELVGCCLREIFSAEHEIIAADGRLVDVGPDRADGRFMANYPDGEVPDGWNEDYLRFNLGIVWSSSAGIRDRADLMPVYALIFRRLQALSADWIYHFLEITLGDVPPLQDGQDEPEEYSPSEAFAAEQAERERQEELARFRLELAEANEEARREAMDRPPPATVRAYQVVYGRDPRGWPPA